MTLSIIDLPFGDPVSDFAPCASEVGAFFLDSAQVNSNTGRYSFWGMHPLHVLQSESGFVTRDGHTTIDSPIDALKQFYQEYTASLLHDPYRPFVGGIVGFAGYEWGLQLEEITPKPVMPPYMPDSWWGFYPTIVGYDHLEKTAWVSSQEGHDVAATWVKTILENRQARMMRDEGRGTKDDRNIRSDFRISLSKVEYAQAFGRIKQHLEAGDCYQINLTQQFAAPIHHSPWVIYQKLREQSPAPYACFLQLGNFQILSSSPECFLQASAGHVTTRPIKGTRPRSTDIEQDQRFLLELAHSEKDKAELLMITDLERNDFGKVCKPGSIEVLHLNRMESFAQVHHLVSVIRGQLKDSSDIIDCLAAMMPGGSITGAPKRRALQIIEALEPIRRGLYTGTIGWLGPNNSAHLNIAIRTIVTQEATAYFHAGSGVVIDSNAEAEYEETLLKARGMMESLNVL